MALAPRRIALFVHCFFPEHFYGTESYTLTLAERLRERGHEVTVVSAIPYGEAPPPEATPDPQAAWWRYRYRDLDVIAIDRNRQPARSLTETYLFPEAQEVTGRLLDELDPELVHVTHLIHHSASLLDLLAERGIPVVATLTDFFGFCYTNRLESVDSELCPGPNPDRSNCLACSLRAGNQAGAAGGLHELASTPRRSRWLARALPILARLPGTNGARYRQLVESLRRRPDELRQRYQSYRGLIAPTRFLQSAYQTQGFPPTRLQRFGVDVDRAPKPEVPKGTPLRIGFVGQMAPHKGVDLLVESCRGLPPATFRLDLWGPNSDHDPFVAKLRARAEGLPIHFRGTFPPDRMSAVMAPLDLLVIPSTWYENSPLVLLNALATHTPVLVSDVAGLTEFLEEGRGGWSFPRGNGAALARQLTELVADPERVRRESAGTNYPRDTRIMAADVERLYAEVLDQT